MSGEIEEKKVGTFTLSRDFSTLMFIGKLNSVFGWVMVAVCVVAFFAGVGDENIWLAAPALFGIPISLLVVASGQVISCFVYIERNTKDTLVSTERNSKDTSEILNKILDKMEDKPIQQEEGKEKQ